MKLYKKLLLSLGMIGLVAHAERVVELEPRVYEGINLDDNTIYRGNLPKSYLENLISDMIISGTYSTPTSSKYTIIDGHIAWGTNATLENVQVFNSLGYLGSSNTVRNNLVLGDGIESNTSDDIVEGNVFLNGWYGIFTNNESFGGNNINNNFFGWNTHGIICQKTANIGDASREGNNIFYKNDFNLDVRDRNQGKIPAEMNFWYDIDGNFLTNEEDILDTILGARDVGQLREESNIDVVPFQTNEPYQQTTGLDDWEFYK